MLNFMFNFHVEKCDSDIVKNRFSTAGGFLISNTGISNAEWISDFDVVGST